MRHSPIEPVEIACQIKRQTGKAWLIYDGKTEVWIPISQITDHATTESLAGEQVTSIFIPQWLAHEKGLI